MREPSLGCFGFSEAVRAGGGEFCFGGSVSDGDRENTSGVFSSCFGRSEVEGACCDPFGLSWDDWRGESLSSLTGGGMDGVSVGDIIGSVDVLGSGFAGFKGSFRSAFISDLVLLPITRVKNKLVPTITKKITSNIITVLKFILTILSRNENGIEAPVQ